MFFDVQMYPFHEFQKKIHLQTAAHQYKAQALPVKFNQIENQLHRMTLTACACLHLHSHFLKFRNSRFFQTLNLVLCLTNITPNNLYPSIKLRL